MTAPVLITVAVFGAKAATGASLKPYSGTVTSDFVHRGLPTNCGSRR